MELKDKLSTELYEKVTEELGDTKVIVNDGNYIPKSRLNEEIDKKKALQSQVDTLSSSLNELKDKVTSVEELETALSKTNETLTQAQAEYEANLKRLQKDSKFEMELMNLKPKNLKAAKALFDKDKISVDGDNLVGFREQAESILEENSFLFGDNAPPKDPPSDNGESGVYKGDNPFKAGSINYAEQIILKKTKPALYEKLKQEAGRQ